MSGRTPRPPDDAIDGVLRAVAELLTALGVRSPLATDSAAAHAPATPAAPNESDMPAAAADVAFASGDAAPNVDADPRLDADVAFMLDDARVRAHRVIDESAERARALLRAPSNPQVERLAESVGRLTVEVHGIRGQLDRVERLLRRRLGRGAGEAGRPAAVADPATGEAPALFRRVLRFDPVPAEPAGGRWLREASGLGMPVSALPVRPSRARPDTTRAGTRASTSTDVAFVPEGGPLTIRTGPLAGFSWLMQIEDALARLAAVSEAVVVAYAEGEARLQLELLAPLTGAEIATAVAYAIGSPALAEHEAGVGQVLRVAVH